MTVSRSKIINNVLVAFAAMAIIVWCYPHQRARQYIYEEGRPWNYAQLIAPFDIPIHPDSATVVAARDTLQALFVPIYTLNETVIDSIITEMPAGDATSKSRLSHLVRRIYQDGVVDSETYEKINRGELKRIRVLEGNVLSERSTQGLISPARLYRTLDSLITDTRTRHYFSGANLNTILCANLVYSEDENKRHFENEYQTLTADRGVIVQGQAIINKGDIITPQDFTNLRTYEQMVEAHASHGSRSGLLTLCGQAIYAAILLGLLLAYCAMMEPEVFGRFRGILFIYSLIVLMALLASGLSTYVAGGLYLVPMALVPILILVFFGARLAMFASATAVLIIAPMASFTLEFVFLEFSAATAAVYTLRELSRRSHLLRTAGMVAMVYVVGYVALELFMNGSLVGFSWRMPIILLFSALLTSTAYILMSAIERIFGFVSVVTLSELSDTNQPLLRELSDTCPGTFQHSMSVSNLVSDAARAMGANEPLVRAGALYHDIGKMGNPAFFTENQHGVNPHDALPPEQSAKIVINHIADGLKRADRAGLPSVIKAFIREHHGSGKAKYFYYQYCQAHPEDEISEEVFTYPGPNPRTRESSLLMMADAVEAASRSLSEYTKASITALVDKIIDGQITEGLHADSTLEFRDVPLIKAAFVKRLMTLYHTRISYPTAPQTK